MTSTDAEDLQSYKEGTKNSSNKLVRKYKAAIDKTLKRLQSEEANQAWKDSMVKEETLKAHDVGVASITKKDLEDGMTQKGKLSYETSTGAPVTQEKWQKESKEYRDAAKQFSEDKPIATTLQEKASNMNTNMIRMINIKRRKLGLPEETL